MAFTPPLSGDVQGFAPTHPTDPGSTAPPAMELPKGAAMPAANPPKPVEEAPAAPPPVPDRTLASADDQPAPSAPAWLTEAPEAPAAGNDQSWLDAPLETAREPAASVTPTGPSTAMRQVVDTNLKAAAARAPEKAAGDAPGAVGSPALSPIAPADPLHDFVHGLQAGLQISVAGLGIRGKMPDKILPEHADMAMRIGNQIGTLAGDLPAMIGGGLVGAAAGTLEAPVIGTVGFGMAGAFAAPAAIRKMQMDHLEKGDITDRREFVARLMATTWEGIKGAATGLATSVTGGLVNPVAGKLAGAASELVAMTTVGSALEGHLPQAQDFIDGAIVLGTLHGVSAHLQSRFAEAPTDAKLRNIYAQTGETPAQIIEQASKDVELKQQLVAGNMQEPPQAAPTELAHSVERAQDVPGLKDIWGKPVPGKVDLMSPGAYLRLAEVPEETITLANGKKITIKAGPVSGGENFGETELGTKLEMPGVMAYDEDGKVVGRLPIGGEKQDGKFVHTSAGVEVAEERRREGIASAMYEYADRNVTPLAPGNVQTAEGAAFSKNRIERKIEGTKTELTPADVRSLGIDEPITRPAPNLGDLAGAAEARQEVLSHIGAHEEAEGKTFGEKFKDFYARNIDFLDPLNAAIKESIARGAEISPEENAYNKGRLAAAHMDKTRSFLEFGTRDGVTEEKNGEALNDIYKDTPGGDMDGLRAYAMAKQALDLHARGIEPWGNFDKEGAQKLVDSTARQFEEVNQRRIEFSNRVLEYARDKGLFSQSQIDAMNEANPNYSPSSRAFEIDRFSGEEQGSSGNVAKKIKGSARELLDPVLQTYKNTEAIIKASLTNETRSTFVENLRAGNLLEEGELNKNSEDAYLKRVEAKGGLRDNQIALYQNGERVVYEGTPGVIDSLKRLDGDKTAMDWTTKVLKGFSNALRVGVVSNPAFGFAHFFRSQIMSGVYSKTGMIPFIHSALSLGDFMGKSEVYQDWLNRGGATGSLFKLNETYLEDNKVFAANKDAPFIGKAWNVVKSIPEASEAFIKLTDNLSRFTEYKRSLERGVGPVEAALRSRDVVPDYAKAGLQRSVLRTGVAFIGAHVNSLDRMAQEIKTDPKGFAMKMSVLTGMSAALWYVNKDDPAIEELPDWQKNTYWNINLSRFSPGYEVGFDEANATILRLPKPWAPGILFGSGVEVALDAFYKEHPKQIGHFSESLSKSVFPELVPTMFQPILDQYSNKQAFTGRPLVPFYKEKLLPEMQYSPYTSETAKAIGKLIGYVPLVKDIGPSTDPLASPAVVENYIKGWGGTIGGWALKISDKGIAVATGKKLDKAEPWQDTPFLHSFVSRYPSFSSQSVQDFYENRDEADKAYNSAKAAAKAGDFDAAEKIRQAHPEFQLRLDQIGKAMSTARKTYENIQEDPNIPAVEKRQNLDSMLFQIGSMAREGNQMMSDFKHNRTQNTASGGE